MLDDLVSRLSDPKRRAAIAEDVADSARKAGFSSELRAGRVVVIKSDGSEWLVAGRPDDGPPLSRLQPLRQAGRHAAE